MLTLAFVVSSISVNCVPLRPHFRSRYPRSRALSFILTSPDNSISKCLLSFRAYTRQVSSIGYSVVPNSGAQLSLRVLKCLAASCERPKPFIVSRTSFKTRSPKPAVVLPEDLSTNVALAVSVAKKVKALIASRHCWSPFSLLALLFEAWQTHSLTSMPQTYWGDRFADLPGHCCLTKPKYATAGGSRDNGDKRSVSLSSAGF